MLKEFDKTRGMINKASKILVISHRKPDADTLGAAICAKILLNKWGKAVTLACIDKPGKAFSFLPYVDEFVNEFEMRAFDLVVIMDAGASYMTDFHLKYDDFFKTDVPIINIDHHASNDNYGEVNIVDPESASTTIIMYRMLKHWDVEIDDRMATCLLGGIYGDTGSFMHSNTDKEVFDVAADLMSKGAEIDKIGKSLFRTNSVSTLKMWGKVLEGAKVTDDSVVISVITEQDYDDVGARPEHLSGVIDYLNMIPKSKFAVLINEDREGNVKGSFRTRREGVDLSRIASVFGGGGHPKASGFSIPGKLKEEVRYNIVSDDMSKKSLEF
jgi:bifunctional oligoribonuclease and PAP phosphatase NrnA